MIDGHVLAELFKQGGANLTKHAKLVDSLNVFPVPDGDTGTNMNLTITSGVKEVRQQNFRSAGHVAKAFSKGLLMGARGNSGVILSQIFRGFARGLEDKEEVGVAEMVTAFEQGVATAYKAVMKPVEGTILTVAKDAAKAASAYKGADDLVALMEEVVKAAKISLKHTPELLPVLKEVGVVDSGGQGLVFIYEGFLAALKGETIDDSSQEKPSMDDLIKIEHLHVHSHLATEDIEFGYCTEVMVKFAHSKLAEHPYQEENFRSELSDLGDSLLVVSDEDLLKIHIHSETPGEVINRAQRFGDFVNIKVENMREQHTSLVEAAPIPTTPAPTTKKAPYGIVTVAMGEGVESLLKSIGATYVVQGGQTMNPSTQDFLHAINQANAEKVFLIPNNSNIIMTAEQAAQVSEQEVIVIPSKNIPQGIAALLSFNMSSSQEINEKNMKKAMEQIKAGEVTYAVRDTVKDGVTIKKDDFMGIAEKTIVSSGPSLLEVTKQLLLEMLDEDSELLTIIWGDTVTKEDVSDLLSFVDEEYVDMEVEVHEGKQPLYSYLLSVE